MDKVPVVYVIGPNGLFSSVITGCSLTKTILEVYSCIPPEFVGAASPSPKASRAYSAVDRGDGGFRSDLARMHRLCWVMVIPDDRLSDLEAILDLLDQYRAQGHRATAEQHALAVRHNRRYVAWCEDTFFEPAQSPPARTIH